MGRTVLLLSFISVIFLIGGTLIAPQSSMFWLASHAINYQYLRAILGFVLIFQFMSRPPRQFWFRLFSGLVAITIGGWAIVATYTFHMQFLDSLLFLQTAVAIGMTALEHKSRLPLSSSNMNTN